NDDYDQQESLLAAAAVRHPEFVLLVRPALEYLARRQRLTTLRKAVSASELQFLLAVLLNVDDRTTAFQLIQQRYPRRTPVDAMVEWLVNLADKRLIDLPLPNRWPA